MKILLTIFTCLCFITFSFSQNNFQFSAEATAAIAISNCSVEHDQDIPNYTFSPIYNFGLGMSGRLNEKLTLEFLANSYYVKYKHKTSDQNYFFPNQQQLGIADVPAKEYNYADMIYLGPTIGLYVDQSTFTWFTSVGIGVPIYKKSNMSYYADGILVDQFDNADFQGKAPLRSQAKIGILLGKRNTRLPKLKMFYAFDFVPQYENSTIKSTYSSLGIGVAF